MSAYRTPIVALMGVTLLCTLLLSGDGSWSKTVHPVGECLDCHLRDPSTNPAAGHLLLGTQERLCARCHPNASQVSHPSGFQPKRQLPDHYPLDWSGNLTCGTCHQTHGTKPGLLRGDLQGKDLCLDCHNKFFFLAMRDGGISIDTRGHLKVDDKSTTIEFDPFSLKCMECHGEKAARKRVNLDRRGMVRHMQDALNHPIGMTYAKYVSYGGYRKPSELAQDILLPNGKVGCISCHQGYSKEHGQLVEGNYKNDLCYECHVL